MLVSLDVARHRVPGLPADDGVAQDLIDEQKAWLARRVGALEGTRTETFYVGASRTCTKLALARYTDEVAVTDGGSLVDPDLIRLVDRGSAIEFADLSAGQYWTGSYVAVEYEPNDATEVQRVLYGLIELAATSVGGYESETMGAYSYSRAATPGQTRAALVASLIPTRDPALTIRAISRRLNADDPVINRAEVEVPW